MIAIIASTSPPTERTVGISLKNMTPNIIAAIGSQAARIDAFPASMYSNDAVNNTYDNTDAHNE